MSTNSLTRGPRAALFALFLVVTIAPPRATAEFPPDVVARATVEDIADAVALQAEIAVYARSLKQVVDRIEQRMQLRKLGEETAEELKRYLALSETLAVAKKWLGFALKTSPSRAALKAIQEGLDETARRALGESIGRDVGREAQKAAEVELYRAQEKRRRRAARAAGDVGEATGEEAAKRFGDAVTLGELGATVGEAAGKELRDAMAWKLPHDSVPTLRPRPSVQPWGEPPKRIKWTLYGGPNTLRGLFELYQRTKSLDSVIEAYPSVLSEFHAATKPGKMDKDLVESLSQLSDRAPMLSFLGELFVRSHFPDQTKWALNPRFPNATPDETHALLARKAGELLGALARGAGPLGSVDFAKLVARKVGAMSLLLEPPGPNETPGEGKHLKLNRSTVWKSFAELQLGGALLSTDDPKAHELVGKVESFLAEAVPPIAAELEGGTWEARHAFSAEDRLAGAEHELGARAEAYFAPKATEEEKKLPPPAPPPANPPSSPSNPNGPPSQSDPSSPNSPNGPGNPNAPSDPSGPSAPPMAPPPRPVEASDPSVPPSPGGPEVAPAPRAVAPTVPKKKKHRREPAPAPRAVPSTDQNGPAKQDGPEVAPAPRPVSGAAPAAPVASVPAPAASPYAAKEARVAELMQRHPEYAAPVVNPTTGNRSVGVYVAGRYFVFPGGATHFHIYDEEVFVLTSGSWRFLPPA